MARRRSKKHLRRKITRLIAGFGLLSASLVFCYFTIQVPAKQAPHPTPFSELSKVPATEMPDRAAALIRAAAENDQADVTVETIRAVNDLTRPGVMPYVIHALCQQNTNLAGLIVSNAVAMEANDKYIYFTVGAAVSGAPQMAESITLAACQAKPRWFCDIALAAAKYSTIPTPVLLRTLVEALPSLQPFFDMAQVQASQYATNQLSMPEYLGLAVAAIKDSGETINSLFPKTVTTTNAVTSGEVSTNQDLMPDLELSTNPIPELEIDISTNQNLTPDQP